MDYIEGLTNRKIQLTEELNAINLLLKIANKNSDNVNLNTKEFKINTSDLTNKLKKASQPEMFLIVLSETNRFMKIREIAKFVVDIIGGEENDMTVKLSRVTGKLKKLKKIKSYRYGNSNTNVFWGSPNWLDENGKIKESHEYDEAAIERSDSSSLPDLK